MERFRIVPTNNYKWRIDKRSSVLFGLIRCWKRLEEFTTFKEAFLYLIDSRGAGSEELHIEDKQGHLRFVKEKYSC